MSFSLQSEGTSWREQRAALKELYAPRPSYLNLIPPFVKEEPEEGRPLKGDEEEEVEVEEPNPSTLSTETLHLMVLQVSLILHIFDGNNSLNFINVEDGPFT